MGLAEILAEWIRTRNICLLLLSFANDFVDTAVRFLFFIFGSTNNIVVSRFDRNAFRWKQSLIRPIDIE